MRSMRYQTHFLKEPLILTNGKYNGYMYAIVSYGPFPACKIDVTNLESGERYAALHGLNLCDKLAPCRLMRQGDKVFISHIYNRSRDYIAYVPEKKGKKYSTENIEKDAHKIIKKIRREVNVFHKRMSLFR